MDYNIIIALSSVIVTNLVTIITLYIHLDNKTDNRIAKIQDMMGGMQEMMRDFHGRLEKIDAEFKAHVLLAQERYMERK